MLTSEFDGLTHAISYVEVLLSKRWGNIVHDEMRRDVPYIIHKTEIPDTYILLNRNYKPLGGSEEDWVKYEDFTNHHIQLSAEVLSELKNILGSSLYLFGDPPWSGKWAAKNYLQRLEAVYRILVKIVGEPASLGEATQR